MSNLEASNSILEEALPTDIKEDIELSSQSCW